MKRIFLFILAGCFSANLAFSQELVKELEVVRAYEPVVSGATKLESVPNMVDTSSLRPEFSYNISPLALDYRFNVATIKPAQISTVIDETFTPYYLKAGLGVAPQSVLDFYVATPKSRNGLVAGAFVNHYGLFSKVNSYVDDRKVSADQTFNTVGGFVEKQLGRSALGATLNLGYDAVTRYGYNIALYDVSDHSLLEKNLKQNYSSVRARVYYGHSMSDLSFINLRGVADFSYMKDKYNSGEMSFAIKGESALAINDQSAVSAEIGLKHVGGTGDISEFKQNYFNVFPKYSLNGYGWDFGLGANLVYANNSDKNKFYFLPELDFAYKNISEAFIPYLNINSYLEDFGYNNTRRLNPYVISGLAMQNSANYVFSLGFRGNVTPSVVYKVYGGYKIVDSANYFVNLYMPDFSTPVYLGNVFGTVSDRLTAKFIGAEFIANISSAFDVKLGAEFSKYKAKRFDKVAGLPEVNLGLSANYKQERFYAGVKTEFIGKRDFISQNHGIAPLTEEFVWFKTPSAFNLSLNGGYNFSNQFGVFVDIDNLLNQEIYRYDQYRMLGVNFIGGIKMTF